MVSSSLFPLLPRSGQTGSGGEGSCQPVYRPREEKTWPKSTFWNVSIDEYVFPIYEKQIDSRLPTLYTLAGCGKRTRKRRRHVFAGKQHFHNRDRSREAETIWRRFTFGVGGR